LVGSLGSIGLSSLVASGKLGAGVIIVHDPASEKRFLVVTHSEVEALCAQQNNSSSLCFDSRAVFAVSAFLRLCFCFKQITCLVNLTELHEIDISFDDLGLFAAYNLYSSNGGCMCTMAAEFINAHMLNSL
jgi:hypothetical protein